MDLYAKGSLATTNASATLTAGGDMELETRWGNIELWGAIQSGRDSNHKHCSSHEGRVRLYSGTGLYMYGAVISLDDVRIRADEGIYIDAAITAADDIEIETNGSLTTTASAPLTAGDDVELYAKQEITIGGVISAGDDVELESRADVLISGNIRAGDDVEIFTSSDIEIGSTIEALDRISLSAKDNLILLPLSYLTGIDGEMVRLVYLFAGDDITLDGTINTKKLIIR